MHTLEKKFMEIGERVCGARFRVVSNVSRISICACESSYIEYTPIRLFVRISSRMTKADSIVMNNILTALEHEHFYEGMYIVHKYRDKFYLDKSTHGVVWTGCERINEFYWIEIYKESQIVYEQPKDFESMLCIL